MRSQVRAGELGPAARGRSRVESPRNSSQVVWYDRAAPRTIDVRSDTEDLARSPSDTLPRRRENPTHARQLSQAPYGLRQACCRALTRAPPLTAFSPAHHLARRQCTPEESPT